jgi:hypothetical protein
VSREEGFSRVGDLAIKNAAGSKYMAGGAF